MARAAARDTSEPRHDEQIDERRTTGDDDDDRARERQPGEAQTRHTRELLAGASRTRRPRTPRHAAQQYQAARELAHGDSKSEGDRRGSSHQRDHGRQTTSHRIGLP